MRWHGPCTDPGGAAGAPEQVTPSQERTVDFEITEMPVEDESGMWSEFWVFEELGIFDELCTFPGCRCPSEYPGHRHTTNNADEVFF